eukprot:CAMPEP_0119371966 /NCGR_PEP_ID=MMETSP1334-20130426/18035_1 /TAXON_ID=127549 /ORGANISM="Calcidiscus leptoporus, Strain RCC1130" /LENGTH=124 /DNA_ID=CAMNT_0007389345 /DNA_START=188 /DNA_END=559 /DNA_ORIENTATION=+
MSRPAFGNAAAIEAKKASLTADIVHSELGKYLVSKWAASSGGSTSDFNSFRQSVEFSVLAKYLTLKDATFAAPVKEALFHEARALGRGAFGAVFLSFKKDTGSPMATKKMMKTIIKDKGSIRDA